MVITNDNLPWFLLSPKSAIERYKRPKKVVALDFETTNLEKGSALVKENHIVLACWYVITDDGKVVAKDHYGDEYDQHELEQDIKDADFVIAHNAKFELQWLVRMGMDLRDILVFDTYLAEWVIGGNRYGPYDLGLEATSQRYGLGSKSPLAAQMIETGVCPSQIPREWLLEYCYRDVELCYQLYLMQRAVLEKDSLFHLVLTRNLCCAVLADIEFNGCELDAGRVKQEYEVTVDEYSKVRAELAELSKGINLRSKPQLAKLLYEELGFSPPLDPKTKQPLRTGKGAYSTTADTLSKLKATTEDQKKFLSLYKRLNKLNSLLTKNLEFFNGVVEDYDSRFFGVFNQGFTQTGRLSSSGRPLLFRREKKKRGAQLQNLPREYKKLFYAAKDGWVCGEADGAQLEFRVGAQQGRDEVAIREIENGDDIHSFTAQVLTEAGEPHTRQQAKSQTFSPMYGGRGKTKATQAYAKFFQNKYSGLFSTQTSWTHEVLNTGKLRTQYGMIFYWPGTTMKSSGYIDNTTSIFNYPIQGFATGEIIPIALVYFWHRTRGLPIELWNTIHDSIASRLHESVVEEYEQISKHCLTTDVYFFLREAYNYKFVVPLGVGVKVSKHWGDSKVEKIWSVWPDGREQYKEK